MRFRMSSRPPAYLDRPLQWRLLSCVAVIAAVMFAFQTYRASQIRAARLATGHPSPDELDFSVQAEPGGPLAPGEFRATQATQSKPRADAAENASAAIDRSLLQNVQDNTLGIRHEESDAFYRVLDHVQHVPAAELEHSSARDVLYVNLMTEPDKYRGSVITIVGDMRRCYELPQPKNGPHERLYEGWVFTSDSGTHPYRVVVSGLGDDVEVGENLRTPVRVTGYFFKREGYDTPGGLHVAPTLLAKRISRYWSPQSPPPADDLPPLLLGAIAAIGLILAATFLSFAWNDRRASRRTEPSRPLSTLSTAAPIADNRSVDELLRELSERDRFGESWTTSNAHEGNGHAG